MNFYLARSFTKALDNLDKQSAALAKRAALDFQIDPSQPGFKFHRIQNARDRNMWSFRINRDLRAIVHHEQDAFILCYVDHHDDAYAWAERHKIEQHPTTGQTQIVEVVERTEVITRTIYDDQTVVLPPLAEAKPELLLSIGVAPEWVEWVQAASEQALLDQLDRFPEDVQHNLLELLTGGLVEPPDVPATLPEPGEIIPSREIVQIDDASELERALDAPWEQWLVFLHPEQREVVHRHYSGAARVFGSAGTGKTIVALHRVKWLLDHYEDEPMLFTTYTQALTTNLVERLELLLGEDVEDIAGLQVTNFHRWLTRWHREQFGQMELATEQDIKRLITEGLELHPDVPSREDEIFSEFRAIIDPYHIRTRKEYFDTPRTGRGKPMGKRQKLLLWKVIEHVHTSLEKMGRMTLNQYSGRCVDYFTKHPDERPFKHVVVDEAQDFSPIELQALRAIARPGEDDLFLCSDAGQRLYGRAFSWVKNGIDIRGRSTQLKINYRTTEQIRTACEALLPEALDGPSEEAESRVAKSLRQGNAITLEGCKSQSQQSSALKRWLIERLEVDRIDPSHIAVLARKTSLALRLLAPIARELDIDYEMLEKHHTETSGLAYGEMKSAKGLEYRAVAIVECDADTVPLKEALERASGDRGDVVDVLEMERNLLYVAGTRARDHLFISYVGKPSQFLSLLVDPPEAPPKPALPEVELHPQKPDVDPATLRDVRIPEPAHEPDTPQPGAQPVADETSGERIAGVWIGSQFRISPSRIAQYFGMNCQRYLRFSSASSKARILADNVPEAAPARDYSRAIFESGYAWEREVLETLIPAERLHVAPGDKPLTDKYFSPEQTLDVLRAAQPGSYIYEMTLVAPEAFYTKRHIDTDLVMMSPCRPDLVEVIEAPQGSAYRRMFRIIDMKRSHSVHASHYIQLAMYALLLEELLRAEGIEDACVDLTHGAIWLGGHEQPTPCDLTGIYTHLEEFLREDAHHIFSIPQNQVSWHVQPKCEWCPYLDHCVIQMNREDDLSRLPRMTHQGKQHLRGNGVYTTADVEQLYTDEQRIEQVISPSATLSSQRYLMDSRARALNHDEVIHQGFMARGLTIRTTTEIKIFLTLQREHLGNHIYALGYEITSAQNVPDRVLRRNEGDHGEVLIARTPEEEVHIRRQFVVELYGLLSRVDAYNLGQSWRDKLSVQCFVYSRVEESLLTELLFAAMEDRETARAARTLLMYFQGPDLILAQEHPDQNVALPVAVLLDMVGRVVALPIPVAYTLPEMLQALDVQVDYPRDPLFHHPFATQLRADAIFEAWYQEHPGRIPEITAHIGAFLTALNALFESLRELVAEDIHLYMPKFELPLTARIQDPLLSKLAFFAQYEAAFSCAQVRNQRMIARRAVTTSERVHELVATSEDTFTLTQPPLHLEESSFKTWLLVRDNDEGRRAQIQYNDFYYRNAYWGGGRKHDHVAVMKVTEVQKDEMGATTSLKGSFTRAFDGYTPGKGDAFLLYERFSNALMDRNIAVLEALEQRPASTDLLRLLLTRSETLSPSPMDIAELDTRTLALTPSQEQALAHIQHERVLALWGPPGTGKTHFLGMAILAMMEAHRLQEKPFRVIIHAFTHAASENVLAKIASLQAQHQIYGGPLPLAKAGGWKGTVKPEGITEVADKKKIVPWLQKQGQGVMAGTAWAYDKIVVDGSFGVELVVMDEASQIKVPEAAIGMNLALPNTGRVILAGDHYQLPPIVAGSYPEPEENTVALHRSVFEAICQVEQGRWMHQLEENFRMNSTLTELSAALIYGERYRCGSESLATAKLRFTPSTGDSEFVRTVLSPDSSIAIVLLHDVPPGKDNEPEAELVAELALALRASLQDDHSGAPFTQDEDFFERGLFMVAPHHSQIQRIRRQLHARREWEAEPFVDTVDKMQGQEAMAVLVSYGVSDPEFAMMEADFIYSRNRLNVSVTRGRHKTVLLAPAALLHAPPRVLEREEAAVGLGYMRQLVAWVREHGEEAMFLHGNHQIEVLTA